MSEKKIFCIVEGQTEANFVKWILSPYFLTLNTTIVPRTIVTNMDRRSGKSYKGGMSSYRKAQNMIKNTLKEQRRNKDSFVTTMIDFYAVPTDTPGLEDARQLNNPYQRVQKIEAEMLHEESDNPHFIPYIQLHEFEALIFANLDGLAKKYPEPEYDIKPLRCCLNDKKNPELINDGADTTPSKRIIKCIAIYDKTTDGIDVLNEIPLEKIREQCRHFNDWLTALEKNIN